MCLRLGMGFRMTCVHLQGGIGETPLRSWGTEGDVVCEQARVQAHEATGDEPDLYALEGVECAGHVDWSEHAEQRRVSFGRAPEQESKPALQPIAVRHGA